MNYELVPFMRDVSRAEILSNLQRKIASTDSLFASNLAGCEDACLDEDRSITEMCESCQTRLVMVARQLSAPDARVWEVWRADLDDTELVGVVYFSDVVRGVDATGHYVFFDDRLADKIAVLEEAMAEMFTPTDSWGGVARLTIEVPAPFVALARHAHVKLGFGGDYHYTLAGGKRIRIEGRKRNAVRWKDELVDLLILGRERDS